MASLPVWMCSWIQGSTLLRSVKIPGDPCSFFLELFLQPRPQPKPQEVTPARVQAPLLFWHISDPPESPCGRKKEASVTMIVGGGASKCPLTHEGANDKHSMASTSNNLHTELWKDIWTWFLFSPQTAESVSYCSFSPPLALIKAAESLPFPVHIMDSKMSCLVIQMTTVFIMPWIKKCHSPHP